MNTEIIESIKDIAQTPSFVFDIDEFHSQAKIIKNKLGNIPLCFSIKANPFLLADLPESVSKVEVCSPGELAICKSKNIAPEMIIYSGVNKGYDDVEEALRYNVGIITAESLRHINIINETALKLNVKPDTIIRLSNGNQFGMDKSDIESVISDRDSFSGLNIIGFHYYTGTQKKKQTVIENDIDAFESFIDYIDEKYGFKASHVEYGPGMAAEYFNAPYEEKDDEILTFTCERLKKLAEKYNLTVEMGRFIASSCGTYLTSVADIKTNDGTNYVICDGGMNHLKYYGQTMAMQIPPIEVLNPKDATESYTLCGSLCTTADIIVRKVELPELNIGDILCFGRCGAYTVTEGIGLFLSRTLPRIVLYSKRYGAKIVRGFKETSCINTAEDF